MLAVASDNGDELNGVVFKGTFTSSTWSSFSAGVNTVGFTSVSTSELLSSTTKTVEGSDSY